MKKTGYKPEFAAAAEYYSNHPLARGIVRAAGSVTAPVSIKEYPGGGVEAVTDFCTYQARVDVKSLILLVRVDVKNLLFFFICKGY